MATHLADLISAHGYWIVAVVVGLESMGIPAPGETTLVTAAIFAGTTQRLEITWVIAMAAIGAIVGDNLGYWIGRRFGAPVLRRYGHLVRISPARVKLGQDLFQAHGGKVVFFGRFVAVLRAFAALLAGINRMPPLRFLFFNALGGLVWAAAYGLAGYWLGERLHQLHGFMALAGLAAAAVACGSAAWWLRKHEASLIARTDQGSSEQLPASKG